MIKMNIYHSDGNYMRVPYGGTLKGFIKKAMNLNIRCIEIQYKLKSLEPFGLMNLNIRCIEIVLSVSTVYISLLMNLNIRCIEMLL